MPNLSRRQLLHGVAIGGAAASIGVLVPERTSFASADAPPPDDRHRSPFHGEHQAGVLDRPAAHTTMAVFDVITSDTAGLRTLFATLTEIARMLAAGRLPDDLGPKAPPADNGVLGTAADDAYGVTLTVGVGASLFDDRFGLADKRPARLTAMPTFPNDDLRPAECHGDLIVQIGGAERDLVLHALRLIAKRTRGAMQVRWSVDGFDNPPRPSGSPRNHFGFKDGISNPDVGAPSEMDQLVWVQPGQPEPTWTSGGTYQVVRSGSCCDRCLSPAQ